MSNKTAWEVSAESDGATDSERTLTRLARKAFLSLWSYPNVYSDEGRKNGKGDGKELADLLVVFGNDVLLFSDKACAYPSHPDTSIAWPRWYRRAIDKSARQLAGAESFIRHYPGRVFLDKTCAHPLPIELPAPDVARYHLIAVTRGGHAACRDHYGGGSSGSLMLLTALRGKKAHEQEPFHVGFPLENGRFVHVLDEMTANLVLEELDTIADFVTYLTKKEAYLTQPGRIVSVPGEEDLLALYLGTVRNDEHDFPEVPPGINAIGLPEGEWARYAGSVHRAAKKEADDISYLWDELIEHHSTFIRAGTAITMASTPEGVSANHEQIVRVLASQTRLARRSLAADLRDAMQMKALGQMFARVKMVGRPLSRAFVFLTIAKPPDEDYEQYRERRIHALSVYCFGIKESMPMLQDAVGIACEPFSLEPSSHEILHVDLSELSLDEIRFWREQANELGVLCSESQVKLFAGTEREFPVPDLSAGRATGYSPWGSEPLNRAGRRKAEAEARRRARKMKSGPGRKR
jgi:hypothetical protein